MLEPKTRPNGRNPASRTRKNSFTDRSEVKRLVDCPGRISSSRLIASSGRPSACGSSAAGPAVSSSVTTTSFLRAGTKRQNAQAAGRRGPRPVEAGDRSPDHDRLGDVVAVVVTRLHLVHPQRHVVDDRAVGAGPGDALRQLVAGV